MITLIRILVKKLHNMQEILNNVCRDMEMLKNELNKSAKNQIHSNRNENFL